jgi:CubicO group peptidase (beta-lactamase class C family)
LIALPVDLQRLCADLRAMSNSSGYVAAGFEPIREAFEQNFEEGLELGAAFAAWLGDELIVDLRGGFTDRAREHAWADTTLCPVFSTTKPVAALVIATLVDQGALEYDAPVADYWPEFAAHGKGAITIAEALSHQAGVPGFPDPIDPKLWLDPQALAAAIADLKLMWGRGQGSGYHPLTWGYIASELVRRVSRRSLGTIMREDICQPLGVDFWIGLPEPEHGRVAQMVKPSSAAEFPHHNEATRVAFLTPWAAAPRGSTEWRKAEIPSANGHGTAVAVARLYSAYAQKGRIGETRVISPAAWEELTRERVAGEDRILPGRVAFGAGVMRNLPLIYGPNPETLCHSGWGGSGAFGDPDKGVAAAYVANKQGTHLLEDARRSRIIDALYGCL